MITSYKDVHESIPFEFSNPAVGKIKTSKQHLKIVANHKRWREQSCVYALSIFFEDEDELAELIPIAGL